jgi:tetratricopeptide (TPR) repeat protein
MTGSGKSSLVASFARDAYSSVYWYEAKQGDTLEDILAVVGLELRLTATAPHHKCNQLIALLQDRNALFVLDRVQLVDKESCGPLFESAKRGGPPCRLAIVETFPVDWSDAIECIGRVRVGALTLEEVRRYVREAHLPRVDEATIQQLYEKTGGIAILIGAFRALVDSGHDDPQQLIHELDATDLDADAEEGLRRALRACYRRATTDLEAQDLTLLRVLALSEGAFDRKLVAGIARAAGADEIPIRIGRLQSTFLVPDESARAWTIHPLFAKLAVEDLTSDQIGAAHRILADYYLDTARVVVARKEEVLSDEQFLLLERACRHLQNSGDVQQAGQILQRMSPTAKGRGFYEKLRRLTAYHLRNDPSRSLWIDYDYAHCCLIQGDEPETLRTLAPYVAGEVTAPISECIQMARLYAEALAAIGQPGEGLAVLTNALALPEASEVSNRIAEHANSVRVHLLTELGRYDEAEPLAQALLQRSRSANDSHSAAIVNTRLGIIDFERGRSEQAATRLDEAVRLFRAHRNPDSTVRDRRGLAWALHYWSAARLLLGDVQGASEALLESIRIKREVDERAADTLSFLKRLVDAGYPSYVRDEIEAYLRWTHRVAEAPAD